MLPELPDPDRLERALVLFVTPHPTGYFEVTGGDESHNVSLRGGNEPPCDCGDSIWRERECKHVLAVRLFLGDAAVRLAAAALVARILSERDAALKRLAALRPRLSKGLRRQIHDELGAPAIHLVPASGTPEAALVVDDDTGNVIARVQRAPGPVRLLTAA